MAGEQAVVGRTIVAGRAAGEVLHANVGLSFWGGVNPTSGEVIDRHHPLSGARLAGNILAIPSGRGSCTGSQVILELLLGDSAPAAIILQQLDEIISLGVIIAQEIFGCVLPVVCLGTDGFRRLSSLARQGPVHCQIEGASVHLSIAGSLAHEVSAPFRIAVATGNEDVALSMTDHAMLDGQNGRAAQAAMRILVRMATLQGARELLDVSQVHIDGCTYIGPAGLRFAQQLLRWGGTVRVPTTLNAISVDKLNWRRLGVPEALGEPADALAEAYLAMGARPTYTCAPYLLETSPGRGEHVGWGESNAVVFANSVIGARTQKYADFLDVCIAITGRAPRAGCHLDSGRLARVVLRLPPLDATQIDDAFYPTLGYLCGLKAEGRIPVVTGLEGATPSRDDLKAFSAAFGTSSSAAMFHIAGVTPEAPDVAASLGCGGAGGDDAGGTAVAEDAEIVELSHDDLLSAWRDLDSGSDSSIDLVSLGNPHFSLEEHARLAELCRGRQKHPSVSVVVTSGPDILSVSRKVGHAEELEQFGVQLISDTCWCMLGEVVPAPRSVLPTNARTLITNSAKYAHYAPGLVGRQVRFASLSGCVDAACTGHARKVSPCWLGPRVVARSFASGAWSGAAARGPSGALRGVGLRLARTALSAARQSVGM